MSQLRELHDESRRLKTLCAQAQLRADELKEAMAVGKPSDRRTLVLTALQRGKIWIRHTWLHPSHEPTL